ncbi:ABC transporter ATP-binding protein [Celeribacter indicus]|uniref:Spermidine/putrescine import ATP-binding protein PotA n=1 Tax=Celeribacter indicus TaxID=1208324 RepID=A0A0B5E3R3_9RHOB|nr:ABC transporter ATP-binding protein [Celeribacter indicus]AJE47042.1 ABC transporter ATP-binding protein [Celeribacter indicus]SDW92292.1 putative spermidine/putrescine transport system ATP-binding protein [Celeribacter indicus]
MSDIRLEQLTKTYAEAVAVEAVTLHIEEGEFYALLGPSGCGKSTTLRMVAGFVKPSAGRIVIGGEDVTALPPEKRDVGIVFQNYAIFPHMTVAENIAFGLKLRKRSRMEIDTAVKAAVAQVGLTGFEDRYQRNLSGGQQQRVALARVLVTRPRILLLDEPLSALDKALREEMKFWIKSLQQELGITTIYVTHDQDEALTMSDRIGVMRGGRVEQSGTPTQIYEDPSTLFVTTFIGQSNVLNGTCLEAADGRASLQLADQVLMAGVRHHIPKGTAVRLVIRPENVLMGAEAEEAGVPVMQARVLGETYQGATVRYRLDLAGQEVVAERQNQVHLVRWQPGEFVNIGWSPVRARLLPAG